MKEGWTYKKLGEVCDTINGLWKGKKPPYIKVGVIRNANFTKDFTLRYDNVEYLDVEEKQYSKRKLYKGDLIVEKSGGGEKQPVGRVVLFDKEDGEFSFSNFTSVLRIKEKDSLINKFLYIYLYYIYRRGDTKKMQRATTGIHNIEFEKFLNIDIPDISLSDQQRIVAQLDEAFAEIDTIKAAAEKQLSDAKALFQKALSQAMTPKEGWTYKTIKDCCKELFAGGDVPKPDVSKNKTNFFSVPIYTNGVENEGLYGYTTNAKVYEPAVTISARGTIGATFRRFTPFFPAIRLITAVPNKDLMTVDYLYYAFNMFSAGDSGTSIPQLTIPNIKNIILPLPPLSEQQRIVEELDELAENVKEIEKLNDKLAAECDAMKQALLRQVFE